MELAYAVGTLGPIDGVLGVARHAAVDWPRAPEQATQKFSFDGECQTGQGRRLRRQISVVLLPTPAKPQTNRWVRALSTLGRRSYFRMICRSASAQIFPQRGCKLNEPHVPKPSWQFDERIIDRSSPPKLAHDLFENCS
jgi:hypothetical protein